tara:strand:- start:56 stop:484 length:429 start_codon:yes stop_codon:yes gene_type:complete
MSFGESISTCFRKYAKFQGRASRSEYWYFVLFIFICYAIFAILAILAATYQIFQIIPLFIIATILPSFAVTARRLHDVNKSGWLQLLPLPFSLMQTAFQSSDLAVIFFSVIALGLYIYLIFLYCKKGEQKDNDYGENIYQSS